MVIDQEQPLEAVQPQEDTVRQVANVVVAQLQAFQVKEATEAAQRDTWYVVVLKRPEGKGKNQVSTQLN